MRRWLENMFRYGRSQRNHHQHAKVRNPHGHTRPRLEQLEARQAPAVITVLNTDPSGDDSLRDAIEEANEDPDHDTIVFNIDPSDPDNNCNADNVCSIQLTERLVITNPVTITGYEEDGSQIGALRATEDSPAVLKIELDGSNLASGPTLNGFSVGLDILADNTTVTGLIINRFGRTGIRLGAGSNNNTIVGNFLGTDAQGEQGLGNQFYGIEVEDSANNTIGGRVPGARNVISGNTQFGVAISNGRSTGNRVEGNFIGTDRDGKESVPNVLDGVLITASIGRSDAASQNTIGGSAPGARNIISSNTFAGVEIYGGSKNTVENNYIGLDVDGQPLGNTGYGAVLAAGAEDNVLTDNVISANSLSGVSLLAGTNNNKVQANLIGTDPEGNCDLDDQDDCPFGNLEGIGIINASHNLIGGDPATEGNIISGNHEEGIVIQGPNAHGNQIQSNTIGLNREGDQVLPNQTGILLTDQAHDNFIGPGQEDSLPPAMLGNVISGNKGRGVVIEDGASSNFLAANLIGTDPSGACDLDGDGTSDFEMMNEIRKCVLGNTLSGVVITDNAESNSIGWDPLGDGEIIGNVISGNGGDGISLSFAGPGDRSSNTNIAGNIIGLAANGMTMLGNGAHGAAVFTPDNTIGGTTASARNVISSNQNHGILLQSSPVTTEEGEEGPRATGNQVLGNYIGTDEGGTLQRGNAGAGINIARASENQIGGPNEGAGNLISGNQLAGVQIQSQLPSDDENGEDDTELLATNNVVQGNTIGTDMEGNVPISNEDGISIVNAPDNIIGGNNEPDNGLRRGNLISGNLFAGVEISGEKASNNSVLGNVIGTNRDGTERVPNEEGIGILGAPNNRIGGSIPGERNIISGNEQRGILIQDPESTDNQVIGNFIGTDHNGTCDLDGDGEQDLEDGTCPLGNRVAGIVISNASFNIIGGFPGPDDGIGEGNVISGNGTAEQGIGIAIGNTAPGQMARGNIIQGNRIGTDVSGMKPLGNTVTGVMLDGRTGTVTETEVGTVVATTGLGNVISANISGVTLTGEGAKDNLIQGNLIGTDAGGGCAPDSEGNCTFGNEEVGVLISEGASDNLVGGRDSDDGMEDGIVDAQNVIAFNGQRPLPGLGGAWRRDR